jgi:hypothetical protein
VVAHALGRHQLTLLSFSLRSRARRYGLTYGFELRDAKGKNEVAAGIKVADAVALPEWLCPADLVCELAERAGMKLVLHQNFWK